MINAMRRLPLEPSRLLTAALAAAIGLQLTWMIAGAFGARDAGDGAPDTRPQTISPFDLIKSAQLFGRVEAGPADPGALVPVSTQGLVLAGVLASTEPQNGRAIIGESTRSAQVYTVGATLPGGSRLFEVYPDRVVLDRGGGFETLPLPRQSGTPGSAGAPAQPTIIGAAAIANVAVSETLASAIRWQAVMRSDKPSGVRVYPGSDAQRFTNFGLQPGDLILAINDTPLADQANGEQFLKTLAGAPQARLTLERNGRTETVTIDLATPAAAPDELSRP